MIDWSLISEAITFYGTVGYTYVDTPWVVPNEVSRITFPGDAISCQFGDLVGSAEQGFLARPVEAGAKLVSCSPCFRNEPVINDLYERWFMKVELYREGHHLNEVLRDAQVFLDGASRTHSIKTWGAHHGTWSPCEVIETSEGYDLNLNGIEVGSYGVRTHEGREWTYGTGIALPRFTVAVRYLERYAPHPLQEPPRQPQ